MLQDGQTIKLNDNSLAKVISVNESRAHIKLLAKTEKHISTRFGEGVTFLSSGGTLDISPNSEVEIVSEQIKGVSYEQI